MSGESITVDTGDASIDEDLASFILTKFFLWDGYKDGAKALWKETEAYIYATDTKNGVMGQGAFDHTNHIPVVAPISQDLEAIMGQVIFPHDDWFNFKPYDQESATKQSRDKIKSFIKNRHAVSGFNKVRRKLVADFIHKGNCFAMVKFDNEEREDKRGYVGPRVMRISPYDIVFDPAADSFLDTAKIIRQVVSLGEVHKWAKAGKVRKEAAEAVLDSRKNHGSKQTFNSDKDQQYIPAGFTDYNSYMTSGVVEILWFYGDIFDSERNLMKFGRKIACIDGQYILVDDEIDTVDGKPHIYQGVWQERPDNLWGMGPLDNIVGINHQVNHRENAKNDALDKLIYPDKVFLGDVEEVYDDETGASIYLAPEGGGVNELAVNTQFFQFDLEIDRMQQIARTAARLPLDLIGFRSPGEKTFGEVSALTEGAMRGFIHKAQDLEAFFGEILAAELELSSMPENQTAVLQVPGQVENGVIPFLEIAQKDLKVTGALVPEGALRFTRKNQVLSTMTQFFASGTLTPAQIHISGKKWAKLFEEMAELEGTGIVEEYAQITEGAEAAKISQQAEQLLAGDAAQPTLQEDVINQEMGE